MRRPSLLLAASALFSLTVCRSSAAILYWDINGINTGATDTTTATGIWGTDNFWSTDSTGAAATAAYVVDSDATFSAGTNATGAFTISLAGNQSANSLAFQEGTVTLGAPSSGSLTIGTGGITLVTGLGGNALLSSNLASVILNGSQSWTNNTSGAGVRNLQVNAAVVGTATTGNTQTLTLAGAGNFSFGTAPNFGSIGDGSAGGNLALTKSGAGTAVLNLANTYTGATNITGGILSVNHANALGGTTAGTTVQNGASLAIGNNVTTNASETLTISGAGFISFGALTTNTGVTTATWGGSVTLGDTAARIGARAGATLRVEGPVLGSGANQTFSVSGEFGTGAVILASTGSTYTGNTGIVRGKLLLGATNALPTGTVLDMHTLSGTTDASVFDLNGFDQTIARLQRTAGNSVANVTNSASGAAKTLNINQTSGTQDFGSGSVLASITGNLALQKSGDGTFTLSALNTYTGGTTLTGGNLGALANGAFGTGNVLVEDTAVTLTIGAGLTNVIADTALLSLEGGGLVGTADFGFLTIAAGVNETVNQLMLGGLLVEPGIYGSSASSAPLANQFNEYFSGAGTITVLIPEPATGLIFATGVGACALRRRRKS